MRQSTDRLRARDLGVAPGTMTPGPLNAITDVAGVLVGHETLRQEPGICTGATAILPHGGNLYQDRVPAGLAVGNGYGKLVGVTQLVELGELETPVVLTNTLAVPQAADAIIDWTLGHSGNSAVVSVNPVVGETNDARLNNIRRRALSAGMIRACIERACPGPVAEGCVGAGTGTVAFGWKGGIGTSSRCLPPDQGGFRVGVLVQSNYGGDLHILGIPVGRELPLRKPSDAASGDGSIMIVVATDAPLSDRNLARLARRGLAGLARTGAAMSNGSGDYVIAFSTTEGVRRTSQHRRSVAHFPSWPNERMTPLFQAVMEATEEAIYNSLFMASTTQGFRDRIVEALPLDAVLGLLQRAGGSS